MEHRGWRRIALLSATALVLARAASAGLGVPLTLDALITQSDVIVLGRVTGLASGVDPARANIYTYVTIEPSIVFKGAIEDGPLVIAQLGGIAGNRGVYVVGQPSFTEGEQVLLFLGTRARDGSLFPLGAWQGKWSVGLDAQASQLTAFKTEPQTHRVVARRSLAGLQADVARLAPGAEPSVRRRGSPVPPHARQMSAFVLNDPPIRWEQPQVLVHVELGAQPGLGGGGFAEIVGAVSQWNAAGSMLTLQPGSRLPPRCLGSSGTDILITFNDPCDEISSDPSLLAVAAFGFDLGGGRSVNGRFFLPITDAVITTSAHPSARQLLNVSPCFQSTMAHEIGHAIGLDHTPDPSALMYFTETGACFQGPTALAPDDLAGLFTIYPASGAAPPGGVPGAPVVTSAVAAGGVLHLAWTTGPGSVPTGHRLDFFAGSALVATVTTGPATAVALAIPAGTQGTFAVQVAAIAGTATGPPSAAFPFTIGAAGGGCSSPPSSPRVQGAIIAGTATVSWAAVPGATAYLLSAGSSQGAANVAPVVNIGLATSVSATGLPAGFSAWVRVVAVNGCGQSAPGDFFLPPGS